MRFFATFDAAIGTPQGFYNNDIYPDIVNFGPVPAPTESNPSPVAPVLSVSLNPAIPSRAVEITAAQWREFIENPGARRWDGSAVAPYSPPPQAEEAPDSPTLSDWRVALRLWGRFDDVKARVGALVASTDPAKAMLGEIAHERLEYANNVLRAQLMALRDAFGFSEAEVEESLWRADRVRQGDLSGVWPVSA